MPSMPNEILSVLHSYRKIVFEKGRIVPEWHWRPYSGNRKWR